MVCVLCMCSAGGSCGLWSVFCACAVLAVLVVCVLCMCSAGGSCGLCSPVFNLPGDFVFSKPALDGTLCCCMTVRCSYLC